MTVHVQERMSDRRFSEVDLRMMLEAASQLARGAESGCWEALARYGGRIWTVIVVPDFERRRIVVVTAYPID